MTVKVMLTVKACNSSGADDDNDCVHYKEKWRKWLYSVCKTQRRIHILLLSSVRESYCWLLDLSVTVTWNQYQSCVSSLLWMVQRFSNHPFSLNQINDLNIYFFHRFYSFDNFYDSVTMSLIWFVWCNHTSIYIWIFFCLMYILHCTPLVGEYECLFEVVCLFDWSWKMLPRL